MPSGPQPWFLAMVFAIQVVNEPAVVVPMVLPLRSSTFLNLSSSARTTSDSELRSLA